MSGADAHHPLVDAGSMNDVRGLRHTPPAASADEETPSRSYDGVAVSELRAVLGMPELHLFATTSSTLDVAHRLGAEGAVHGTLVIADRQTAGRGRGGKTWASPPGAGVWMTLLARPAGAVVPQVLTVRLGLAAARALDALAPARIDLKWPNDLLIGDRKLAGVLVEARWRGARVEWVAVGIGINVTAPGDSARGIGLGRGVRRIDVLQSLVPALQEALGRTDPELDSSELREYAARDRFHGAACVEPRRGIIRGINRAAELLVETSTGVVAVATGSLVLQEAS